MPAGPPLAFDQALGVLRQFRGARRPSSLALEHCELCSLELYSEHPHLIELASRQLVCACTACALLFDSQKEAKFKRVLDRIQMLRYFDMTEAQWESLVIPINLAFFFRSSMDNRTIALYPSPAGAVESMLPLDTWTAIVKNNPQLQGMRSDIEALLVNRIRRPGRADSAEYYIAPIDQCYRLVGLIRAHWKGLSGGAEVWEELDRFFSDLRSRAEVVERGADA
jgi:Family of unknown function (DUF5947)